MAKHSWNNPWIIANYGKFKTTKDLHKAYIKANGGEMEYDTFKWHVRVNLGLSKDKFKMSQEQEEFIKQHFDTMSVESLRKLFNKTFGLKFKTTAFHYHCKRLGLNKWTPHYYTNEQETFLKEYAPITRRKELTRTFNDLFNSSIKEDALVMHCWKRGYGALDDGRFAQERIMTIYIDGNPDNLDENNIRQVDFNTYSWIKNNGWHHSGAELLDTAIMWCKLMRSLHNKEEE